MSHERTAPTETRGADYLSAILEIEDTCRKFQIDHRFVGGALTDFLNIQTRWEIDFPNRRILLKGYTPPQMYRSDQTPKDVDIISLSPYASKDVYETKKEIAQRAENAKRTGKQYPHPISIEGVKAGNRSGLSQFRQLTSGLDVEITNDQPRLFLTFDRIKIETSWETVEPWQVILTEDNNAAFTTLNPYAHALRYLMRVPSGMKKKDQEMKASEGIFYDKMLPYVNLALDYVSEAGFRGVDINSLYGPWLDFITRMRTDQSFRMKRKRGITGSYWGTIGTAMAHGRGILKPFAAFSGAFNK